VTRLFLEREGIAWPGYAYKNFEPLSNTHIT